MNYENPSPHPVLTGQEALRERVRKLGFEFYEELPEGWLIVDDMIAPFDLVADVDGRKKMIEELEREYDVHFGIMAMRLEDDSKLNNLLSIIARDPKLDRDSGSDFADPEHPDGKKVLLKHADGHEVEFTIVEGEGLPSIGPELELSKAALGLYVIYGKKGVSDA